MTDSISPHALPDAPPAVPDDIGARLEARVDQLEHAPEALRSGSRPHRQDRVPAAPDRVEPPASDPAAGVVDLNDQLVLLREQLEAAFDDVDERIAALRAEVSATATQADSADARAQVASARAANVLAAVEALTEELDRVVEDLDPAETRRLTHAVNRLRGRLRSA